MHETLARAFKEASRLPESDQADLAHWILDRLAPASQRIGTYEEQPKASDRLAEDTTVDYSAHGKDSPFLLDEEGKRKSVVMPVEEYLQMLEDIQDLALIAERKDEPTEPLDAVLERLGKGEKER